MNMEEARKDFEEIKKAVKSIRGYFGLFEDDGIKVKLEGGQDG